MRLRGLSVFSKNLTTIWLSEPWSPELATRLNAVATDFWIFPRNLNPHLSTTTFVRPRCSFGRRKLLPYGGERLPAVNFVE